MHGGAPKNLAMVVNKPKAPKATVKFKSFKEVMSFLRDKSEDEGQHYTFLANTPLPA